MNSPKVIFLDWYKTLSASLFWENLKNDSPDEYQIINNCLMKDLGDFIKPWMRGGYTSEDISIKISENTGLDKKFIFDNLIQSAKTMKFSDERLSGLIKEARKKGKKVVIATDNMDTFSRWTIPGMGLEKIFDGILNSWNIKSLKADFSGTESNFFSKYLESNDLKPSDCVLIDDGEDKGGKISGFGMGYIRINSTEEVLEILRNLI